ncbi:unnamed protein product [Hapterophycus canaliculatus]
MSSPNMGCEARTQSAWSIRQEKKHGEARLAFSKGHGPRVDRVAGRQRQSWSWSCPVCVARSSISDLFHRDRKVREAAVMFFCTTQPSRLRRQSSVGDRASMRGRAQRRGPGSAVQSRALGGSGAAKSNR